MLIDVHDSDGTNKLLLRYDPECRIIQLWVKRYDNITRRFNYVTRQIDLDQVDALHCQTAEVPSGIPSVDKAPVSIPSAAD